MLGLVHTGGVYIRVCSHLVVSMLGLVHTGGVCIPGPGGTCSKGDICSRVGGCLVRGGCYPIMH